MAGEHEHYTQFSREDGWGSPPTFSFEYIHNQRQIRTFFDPTLGIESWWYLFEEISSGQPIIRITRCIWAGPHAFKILREKRSSLFLLKRIHLHRVNYLEAIWNQYQKAKINADQT